MSMLADLTGATDPALRDLARRLAGRVFLDLARRGPSRPRGVGRLTSTRYRDASGDIDLDASLDAIVSARSTSSAIDPEELRVTTWSTPATAICLLVDRSGSMGGAPLATNAVAASAAVFRAPGDCSVISFGKDCVAVASQGAVTSNERVVDAVLALRGFGTTDVAGALVAARDQLARSNAARKITVLLSDCRATVDGDVVAAAEQLDELVIVAPDGDDAEARELAGSVGARCATVAGPSDVPAAFTNLLD